MKPVSVKTCCGFCTVDGPPSPKFHNQVTNAPGVVTEEFVKYIVSLAHASIGEKEKLTKGCVPVNIPPGTVSVLIHPLTVMTVSDIV